MRTALLALALLCEPALAAPPRVVLPDVAVPRHYELALTPDAANLRFAGSVQITLDVRRKTSALTLNAASLAFSHVTLDQRSETPAVSFNPEQETATLTFVQPIAPGEHRLTIDYTGTINPHASGLFALDYGKGGRALYTQLENSDARRLLPCWDEPGLKATFRLTATVPAAQMAVSNTAAAATEALPGGLARVRFEPTPKMSSYLLFFALGDFERASRTVAGVDIGVIVTRGNLAKGAYALDAAAELLPWFNDYFGAPYPLPKLDLVAGPGDSQFFGAMENWGAIFYFEHALLVDPRLTTDRERRSIYKTIAHEMAHQWFGDLVTMAWWDDLWLNEGFASWMATKSSDQFHPEWKLWLAAANKKEEAMRQDSRLGTHAVVQPVYDVLQASQAFDSITYSKGEAVIRMLESYVGEDAFRAGVRDYVKAFAYDNAVTDDFWRALAAHTRSDVTTVAHDFTRQEGVPLVRVALTAKGLAISQGRYAVDESGKSGGRWHLPVAIAEAEGGTAAWSGVVGPKGKVLPQGKKDAPPVIVNAGGAGYYRTLYDAPSFRGLLGTFAALAPADQLGLLNDARELGYAGYAPLTDFLEIARHCTPGLDPVVLLNAVESLAAIDALYRELPGQAAYRSFASAQVRPLLDQLGWTDRPGDSQNTAFLRGAVLAAMGQFGDAAVTTQARALFAGYRKDRASLDGNLRSVVLDIVAENADVATWELLQDMARQAGTELERGELYERLGAARDEALARRALDLALGNEAPATYRTEMIGRVAHWHPDMAFDFASAHVEAIYAMLEASSRYRFAPSLVSGADDPALIGKLRAFAQGHIPQTARRSVVRAEAAINYRASIRQQRLPAIDRWLANAAAQQ